MTLLSIQDVSVLDPLQALNQLESRFQMEEEEQGEVSETFIDIPSVHTVQPTSSNVIANAMQSPIVDESFNNAGIAELNSGLVIYEDEAGFTQLDNGHWAKSEIKVLKI